MRVLIFGDSIAQGFWDSRGGWVERLREHYDSLALNNLRNHNEPAIFNLGISGDTTENLLARVELETSVRRSSGESLVVVLAIGTNDELFENNHQRVAPDEFEKNIRKLLEIIKPLSDKIIFVGNAACDEKLTTPVFWADIQYTNEQMNKYEKIIEKVALEQSIPFTPLFLPFKTALDNGQDLLADGLHPNDAGHQLIFELVLPQLDKQLNSRIDSN